MNAATLRLPISRWSSEDKPTERLQRLGADCLSDAELLAILVGSGNTQYSAVDIAKNVLCKFHNNLNTLGKARFDELQDVDGVGIQTACKIMAAVELGKRRQMTSAESRPELSTATRIYNHMLPILMDAEVEYFYVLLMNQAYRLIKTVKISQGALTETSADIRIIMREAVLNNATIMAVCHNHPSGRVTPSKADDMLTQSIKRACEIMRVHLLDHVIVSDGLYHSYRENGKL